MGINKVLYGMMMTVIISGILTRCKKTLGFLLLLLVFGLPAYPECFAPHGSIRAHTEPVEVWSAGEGIDRPTLRQAQGERPALTTSVASDLPSLNLARIEEKKEAWQSHFTVQSIKRGTVCGLAVLMVVWGAYAILSSASTPESKPLEKPILPVLPEKNSPKPVDFDKWFHEQYDYDHSAKGIFFNTLKQSLILGLASGIVGALIYISSRSGLSVWENLKQGLGFGQASVFIELVDGFVRNGRYVAKSIVALSDESLPQSDKEFQKKLYESLLSNVMINHRAFIYACEEWIAFVSVVLADSDCDEKTRQAGEQTVHSISSMISMIVKHEQDMVQSGVFTQETTKIISQMLRCVCQEMLECSSRLGMLWYGDAFLLAFSPEEARGAVSKGT